MGARAASRTAPGRRCPCRRTGCCTASGRHGRYGRPWYTNVRFPFPIDPPHVPDENPVGDYRRTFDHPGWDVASVLLRFDGVESVYRVVLNGAEVGVGKGSRLVQEFDVTELLVARAQRARRAGAPVVVDELRRGPGPVVAAGDLPRRHAARPPARRPGRRVAAHRLRRTAAGTVDPEISRRLPGHDRDPGAGRRAAVRLGRGRGGVRRRAGRAVDGRDARGSTTPP